MSRTDEVFALFVDANPAPDVADLAVVAIILAVTSLGGDDESSLEVVGQPDDVPQPIDDTSPPDAADVAIDGPPDDQPDGTSQATDDTSPPDAVEGPLDDQAAAVNAGPTTVVFDGQSCVVA